MKFEDHISTYWARPSDYDHAAEERRLSRLCAEFVKRLTLGLCIVKFGRYLGREVRRIVKAAEQERRYHRKLHMLRQANWRLRVIQDLGGIDKLLRLIKRQQETIEPVKQERVELSEQERLNRIHIQNCAKACTHPNIMRDPFRVDKDAEFRLPPMPKRWPVHPPWRDYYYEYSYDARPLTNLTGLNTPIMVWPEEFLAFMNFDTRERTEAAPVVVTKTRYKFVQKWLAALLAEISDSHTTEPPPKIKTARAPPC